MEPPRSAHPNVRLFPIHICPAETAIFIDIVRWEAKGGLEMIEKIGGGWLDSNRRPTPRDSSAVPSKRNAETPSACTSGQAKPSDLNFLGDWWRRLDSNQRP